MKLRNAIGLIVLLALLSGCGNSGNRVMVVSDVDSGFGNSVVWNSQAGRLYWVDVTGKILNLYNPVLDMHRELYLGQLVFSVAPIDTGDLLVLLENGFYRLDPVTGTKQLLIHFPEDQGKIHRAVGAIDPAGRFWVSITFMNENIVTKLFRVEDAELSVIMDSGIGVSGGMSWSADKTLFYYLNSEESSLISYTYDVQSGSILLPGKSVELASPQGMPTGMVSDNDGNLWIGHWGTSHLSSYNPLTGEIRTTILLPVNFVTSLTFGDSDLGTLYITTAKNSLDGEPLSNIGLEGRLLRLRPEVGGAAVIPISNL